MKRFVFMIVATVDIGCVFFLISPKSLSDTDGLSRRSLDWPEPLQSYTINLSGTIINLAVLFEFFVLQ